jgi:hypothetical protein
MTLLAAAVVLAGCGLYVEEDIAFEEPVEESAFEEPAEESAEDSVEDSLDDVAVARGQKCVPAVVGEEFGTVPSIYAIVDGELGEVCFGEPSAVLEEAWAGLAAVTPIEELEPLVLLAGFDGGGDTLAFTAFADARSVDRFLVAVDLVSAEDYPDELVLTMVHELAHVFTQTPDQLDVFADPELCETFWNGAGCFYDDSYVGQWIDDFWTEDELFAQPGDGSADEPLGEERCEVDPGYLGAYAASSPEEDFAETFSAFVFDLDVSSGVEPKMVWFDQFPELVAFRDLQRDSGLPEVPNPFDTCG